MVSDRFWMIYGIIEKHQRTGKWMKYAPAAWGLSNKRKTVKTSKQGKIIIYVKEKNMKERK